MRIVRFILFNYTTMKEEIEKIKNDIEDKKKMIDFFKKKRTEILNNWGNWGKYDTILSEDYAELVELYVKLIELYMNR